MSASFQSPNKPGQLIVIEIKLKKFLRKMQGLMSVCFSLLSMLPQVCQQNFRGALTVKYLYGLNAFTLQKTQIITNSTEFHAINKIRILILVDFADI